MEQHSAGGKPQAQSSKSRQRERLALYTASQVRTALPIPRPGSLTAVVLMLLPFAGKMVFTMESRQSALRIGLPLTCPILRARHHTTLSAFGSAAEDGVASRAEPASAALIAVANSFGVRYPKLLCGLASLYSIRHAAIFRRASNKFWNQLTIKHSSRKRP